MICIIISLAIAALITWLCCINKSYKWLTFIVSFLFLSSCFSVLSADNITKQEYSYDELANSSKIIALKDNNLSSGTFFLGCGSINNDEYYCYYTVSSEGDIEFNKLSATHDNVKLRYCGDNEQPRVEKYYRTSKSVLTKKANIWTSSVIDYIKYYKYNVGDTVGKINIDCYHEQTIIYIPEGTIQQDYNIDMK